MLKEIETGVYWRGEYLSFEDKGPVSIGAKTRVFKVSSNGGFLGYVKWMARWRKYAFFAADCILDDACIDELSQFMKDRNTEQKEGWRTRSIVDWEKVKEYDRQKVTHVESQ